MRTEGNTTVGAANVHWRREGEGPSIVFVHGFPLSGHTWSGVIHELRDRFTCYAPDLIGLVGNDTGGWVARELALIDRHRISHLVLTNTEIPGHRPPWIPTYQALAHVPGFGTVLRQFMKIPGFLASPLAFGGCFQDASVIEGDFRERYVEPLLERGQALDGVLRFLRCMKFTRLDELRTLHAEFTMPTLFIWGADDPTFPELLARRMAAQFPNVAGFKTITEAKLFFHEEQPRAVAELITGFLTGTSH
jgi:haloalkane dehalogenase